MRDECQKLMNDPVLSSPTSVQLIVDGGRIDLRWDQVVSDVLLPMIGGTQRAVLLLADKLDEAGLA